jgi:7-keto-8-aminopelargonate synthetase-like enzyme
MYKLPEQAKLVMDIYDGFDWNQVVQMPVNKTDSKSNKINIHNKEVINFGSSSYVGLHKDERLLNAGIDAMREYGILHSSSRSFTYLSLNDEFESYLEKIFGLPTLGIIQTTMAHFSAMQLLMLPTDVAIIDMQAHATLQSMILLPKARGMKVEMLLHNDMMQLENKIKAHQNDGTEKVWYVADGIYSMYGDGAPVQDLIYLLDKYENFYIYFDDAHGTSWTGPNGAGYIWKFLPVGHPKVVMATSLGKGFGIGGGALICPNPEIKKWMTRAGGGFVFCTQLHTQMLGAGIASAKIHLSDEIYIKQDRIKENIQLFIAEARKSKLPLVDYSETPVFYMTVGRNDLAIDFNQRLRQLGYYGNLGIYPAVPYKNAGMRISITSDHTVDEIKGLVTALAVSLQEVLSDNNLTLEDVQNSVKRTKMKVA